MQIELDDIGSGEAESGQGGKKEFRDDSVAEHANWTGSGLMRRNNQTNVMPLCGDRHLPTIKEVPAGATFGMGELLIGWQSKALLDQCQIQQGIILAAHHKADACCNQIHYSCALLSWCFPLALSWLNGRQECQPSQMSKSSSQHALSMTQNDSPFIKNLFLYLRSLAHISLRIPWVLTPRVASSIRHGTVSASLLMRKLAAYPRQNQVARALTELGKLERTAFLLEYFRDDAARRRILIGLNKGEALHALAHQLFFGRLGELRDRAFEDQIHRASCLHLLMAAIAAD